MGGTDERSRERVSAGGGSVLEGLRVLVLAPVYNDWTAAELLLGRLAEELLPLGCALQVLFIDDASSQPAPENWRPPPPGGAVRMAILRLKRNLGHQRALALGLAYAAEHLQADAVVVMDGDGEDAPETVPPLLRAMVEEKGRRVVFAERQQRSENAVFQLCYWFYRHLHRILTGERIRFGNFSAVPWPLLPSVVSVSEIWNHYAAALVRARIPYRLVPTNRARRLTGESKMNFTGLVIHGLSAISVFGEVIGVKLLLASAISFVVLGAGFAGWVLHRLLFGHGGLGWLALLAAVLLALFIQIAALSLQFAFLVLQARSNASFLPARDYGYYVERCQHCF